MKVLFVTHDAGIYGASRSLRGLLRHYTTAEVHLLVTKDLWRCHKDAAIQEWFGAHVRSIQHANLPFDPCFAGRPHLTFRRRVRDALSHLLWKRDSSSIYDLIKSKAFDAVHLNSIVLHPLIRPELPFVIHIRERLETNIQQAHQNVQNAHGIIFIDESTQTPFSSCSFRRSTILNNPIDMTDINPRVTDAIQGKIGELSKMTVFSLIGWLNENKGTLFVLQNFLEIAPKDARLLLIGGGEPEFVKRCRAFANNDPRVVFWGEEPGIEAIYGISDYILRGESMPCVGRTIYEGLFAGCEVIVPGAMADSKLFFDYEKFKDRIHFYTPRAGTAFKNTLGALFGRKMSLREKMSNVADYVAQFDAFIRAATTDHVGSPPALTGKEK
jgi:hypothetical protein